MPDSGEPGLRTPLMRSRAAQIPLLRILALIAVLTPAFSQEPPRATIRVEVRTDTDPVPRAAVTLNGISLQTDQNGVAITALPLGRVEVSVSKEGFFPA